MPSNKQQRALNQLVDELQTWGAYLQSSAERFQAELKHLAPRAEELGRALESLKKDTASVRAKSKQLRKSLPNT